MDHNTIYTIGHSTRTMAEFTDLLKINGIKKLIDIRHYPGSRKYPHFNTDNLALKLPEEGILYEHLAQLGGRRRPAKDSVNTAWRVEAFRGYADHMATDEFKKGLEALEKAARKHVTAYMCSEAVWWRCHRALVSDALKIKGWKVMHILSRTKVEEHPYSAAAHVQNGELRYHA